MKTKFTLLIILVVTGLSVKAQIPNPSFETWSAGDPTGWNGAMGIAGSVVQSSDAHAGTSSVRINVVDYFGSIFPGSLSSNYFTASPAPVALRGWYKFQSNSGGSESGEVIVLTIHQGGASGGGGASVMNNTSVYMEFVANIYYIGAVVADTIYILASIGSTDSVRLGTYFIIDDLSFGAAIGIDEVSNTVMLEPCSPNPATNLANIIYRVPGHSIVDLAIYDLVGRKVKSLLDKTEQNPGRYKVPADVSTLPEGIYLYRLNVNGQFYTQKLVVAR